MDVELLIVPACPNEQLAAATLRTALDDVGLRETGFTTTVIRTDADAHRRGFVGSPTVLIDGVDPFATAAHRPGLTCRVYRNRVGLSGVPDLPALRQALQRAAASTGDGQPI